MKRFECWIIIMFLFIIVNVLFYPGIVYAFEVSEQLQNEQEKVGSSNNLYIKNYKRLKEVLFEYIEVKEEGGWPRLHNDQPLKPGDENEHIQVLRERLEKEPQQSINLETETETYFGPKLKQAVFNFQSRYGLSLTGFVDPRTKRALNTPVQELINKIIINLEKLKNFPEDLGSRYILVNIPDFKLKVIENDNTVMEMAIITGSSRRPTPAFSTRIETLVFNPRWYVPRSIAVKDFLPRIKKDLSYLEKENMRIYEKTENGFKEKDPEKINWEELNRSNFDYYIWQDAGPKNFLGKVMFNSPNPYHVYLHDTPEDHLFNMRVRTFSSGCVRVEDALGLARYLLDDNSDIKEEKINKILASGVETAIPLSEPVPLHLIYLTAWVEKGGQIQFREDIYGRNTFLSSLPP